MFHWIDVADGVVYRLVGGLFVGSRARCAARWLLSFRSGFGVRYPAAFRYLTSLWVPALHNAFPYGVADARQRRRQVQLRLQTLAFVLNRAAHHEPIHQRVFLDDVADTLAVVGWVSPDGEEWVRVRESLTSVFSRRPAERG